MHRIALRCLEGSTPEDVSGANTQAAPVGRRMCGILHPGCRFALPWAKCLLLFQGVYFAGLSSRTGVYSCLSPCDGCKTRKGDGGAGGKYPSLLEDFQTGTASMARKRHLASTARGFLRFLSYGTQDQIRPIRNISQNPC